MKVLTMLGTRPEIIRLSQVISKLDTLCEHHLVHTGQNYDPQLNEIFFRDLQVRQPDTWLGARGSLSEQCSVILQGTEKLIREHKPDRFLILGDTNSGLGAIIAKRLGVPVYHMEAGNRCFDERVPEEVNRRVIDHSSDVLMPYTERSRQNLLAEGFPSDRIFVTGNPIREVLEHHADDIARAEVLESLGLEPGKFLLVTLHRAENVDRAPRLLRLITALDTLQQSHGVPVIVSTHPRTRDRLLHHGLQLDNPEVRLLDPFGFFDFVRLEKEALCVLSDSGTVQEECALFGVPNVTIRDVTERPETLECGSAILSGAEPEAIVRCVQTVLALRQTWEAPTEYLRGNVSDTVVKILLSYNLKAVIRHSLR